MEVNNFLCPECGYEDSGIWVKFSRTVASGDLCLCPLCGAESSRFDPVEEK